MHVAWGPWWPLRQRPTQRQAHKRTSPAPAFHSHRIIVLIQLFSPNLIRIQSVRGRLGGGFSSPATKKKKKTRVELCFLEGKEKVIWNLPFKEAGGPPGPQRSRVPPRKRAVSCCTRSTVLLSVIQNVERILFVVLFWSVCWILLEKSSRNCLPLSTLPLPPPQKYNPSAPPTPTPTIFSIFSNWSDGHRWAHACTSEPGPPRTCAARRVPMHP